MLIVRNIDKNEMKKENTSQTNVFEIINSYFIHK